MSPHRRPSRVEALHRSGRDDARRYQQFDSRNYNFTNRHENPFLSDAIPNPDVSTARGLRDRHIHIERRHSVAVEIFDAHSFPLRTARRDRNGIVRFRTVNYFRSLQRNQGVHVYRALTRADTAELAA